MNYFVKIVHSCTNLRYDRLLTACFVPLHRVVLDTFQDDDAAGVEVYCCVS